jgi:hypothetical protein
MLKVVGVAAARTCPLGAVVLGFAAGARVSVLVALGGWGGLCWACKPNPSAVAPPRTSSTAAISTSGCRTRLRRSSLVIWIS